MYIALYSGIMWLEFISYFYSGIRVNWYSYVSNINNYYGALDVNSWSL